jgi:hypothetical protein
MWSMFFSQRICFILYNPVYCGIIGLWWAFPSWKRKPTANLELCLACYKLRMNVVSGSLTCDLQENLKGFTSWLGGRYGQESIRTGFFSSHSWAWTAICSCLNNFQETIRYKLGVCFLFMPLQLLPYCMKFFSQGGGWGGFRGSTRRICCTSQDLHLHLHLFFFFCVRRIRTCNSWGQQIAGAERDAAAGGGKL